MRGETACVRRSPSIPPSALQPRVVRLRLRRRARHVRLVLGRAGLAGLAAASLVVRSCAEPQPGREPHHPGGGGARRTCRGALARRGAGHRHVPAGGRGRGACRPAGDRVGGQHAPRGPRQPGRGGAAGPRRRRRLPRHPLAGAGRLPPGGRLPVGHRPRVRAALVAARGHRPDRVRAGRRGPGHQRRYDAGRDPRAAAGRRDGRDGGHPRHRRRGAGPRPGVRPGRGPDAVPAGHVALVRRRRQRGRSLRPVQHLRRRARRRPLPVRLRRRPAHTRPAWPRRC